MTQAETTFARHRRKVIHHPFVGGLVLMGVLGVLVAVDYGTLGAGESLREGLNAWDVLRDISRTCGVLLLIAVSLTAIAVPLTANVWTPKLVEFFIRDRRNQFTMAYIVFANIMLLWNKFRLDESVGAEVWRARVLVSMGLVIIGLMMIVPYINYVLRFLVPRNIVDRLRNAALASLDEAVASTSAEKRNHARREVLENIQYLGDIALRSVDRYDRDTAAQSLHALSEIFEAYMARKAKLPDGWFALQPGDLRGISPELNRQIEEQRSHVETAVLEDLTLLMPLAFERLPEVVEQISTMIRDFGVEAARHRDEGVRDMVTLYFNTFLREALQRKKSRPFYQLVFRYRGLAEELLELDPEYVKRIVFFFDYYAHQAVRMQMPFLLNVVAYDLSAVCYQAYRKGVPQADALLESLARLDRDEAALVDMPGLVKAQIILAARLKTEDHPAPVERLMTELRRVEVERLAAAFDQITSVREKTFWEIADRRMHLDFVEEPVRPALEALRRALLPDSAVGAESS